MVSLKSVSGEGSGYALDLNSTSPAVKIAISQVVQAIGTDFVEGAILGGNEWGNRLYGKSVSIDQVIDLLVEQLSADM